MLLQAESIAMCVGPQRWLWRGLSFDLAAGERLGIRGPSGSGKTSLLRALVGLDRIDEGCIRLRGRALADWAPNNWRAVVAWLPQRVAVWPGSVAANLCRPFELRRWAGRKPDDAAWRAQLQQLGRDPAAFLALDAARLSGGELQIVGLLRTLQLDPAVLLLDEATASLDPDTAAAVERLLIDWVDAGPERALLWVGHDAAQHSRMTTRSIDLPAATAGVAP